MRPGTVSRERGTAGAGRVARPGAPGADRDPGLTHVRSSSGAGIQVNLVQAVVQFSSKSRVALTASADCAGHEIGRPQFRLLPAGHVLDVEARTLGEREPSTADCCDVSLVRALGGYGGPVFRSRRYGSHPKQRLSPQQWSADWRPSRSNSVWASVVFLEASAWPHEPCHGRSLHTPPRRGRRTRRSMPREMTHRHRPLSQHCQTSRAAYGARQTLTVFATWRAPVAPAGTGALRAGPRRHPARAHPGAPARCQR